MLVARSLSDKALLKTISYTHKTVKYLQINATTRLEIFPIKLNRQTSDHNRLDHNRLGKLRVQNEAVFDVPTALQIIHINENH